jgi:hypothetical protein
MTMGGGGVGRNYLEDLELQRLAEVAKNALRKAGGHLRNVFLSFVEEDLNLANALRGQVANEATDLEFNDWSVKEPYESDRAEYIKARIRERIRRSSALFVILTQSTAASRWVAWEIGEALAQGKRVVGVHPQGQPPAILPTEFQDRRLPVVEWTHENIMRQLE